MKINDILEKLYKSVEMLRQSVSLIHMDVLSIKYQKEEKKSDGEYVVEVPNGGKIHCTRKKKPCINIELGETYYE